MSRTPAAAALPRVIGRPGSDFMDRLPTAARELGSRGRSLKLRRRALPPAARAPMPESSSRLDGSGAGVVLATSIPV